MRGEPQVLVTCDICGAEEQVGLTATARGYDEREMDSELEAMGWTKDGDRDYCPDCRGKRRLTKCAIGRILQPAKDQGQIRVLGDLPDLRLTLAGTEQEKAGKAGLPSREFLFSQGEKAMGNQWRRKS